jgi:hypothetical protein
MLGMLGISSTATTLFLNSEKNFPEKNILTIENMPNMPSTFSGAAGSRPRAAAVARENIKPSVRLFAVRRYREFVMAREGALVADLRNRRSSNNVTYTVYKRVIMWQVATSPK